MKRFSTLLVIILIVGASAAYIYTSTKARVEILTAEMDVIPQSFSVSIAKGGHYVKQITIKNTGEEKEVYFEDVVEGPKSDAIDIAFHTLNGSRISSANKLVIPAGTEKDPSIVKVNMHIDVDDDAVEGEYTIYIYARS